MKLLTDPMVLPIAFPMLVGVLVLLIPRVFDRVRAVVAIAAAALTVLLAWPLFTSGSGVLDVGNWLALRVDGISGFVLLAVTVFGLLIALYSYGYMKGKPRQREYYAYLLWTVGISCGAILANNLILLLVFWGFLGMTLYLMIGIKGPTAAAAAKKSFIIIGGSDCVLMLGVGFFYLLTKSFRMDAAAMELSSPLAYLAFLSFVVAAFAKAGAMPLHSWVPDCGEKAPVPVTAFLPASLDKLLGIYLLARAATDMFVMDVAMNTLLMFCGAATIILAVMMALVQHDMKRLLSYHAVSQVGYMVLGIGTGIPIGIAGGLFHMLNNVIYKSCMFCCAGAVEQKTGTTDMDRLGGLAKLMPVTFVTFLISALAISGVPPLNGFFSKWMVYQGVVEAGKGGAHLWVIWLTAAMVGSALTLASFVKVLHAAFLCKPSTTVAGKNIREVGPSMWLPMMVLAALCLVFGVFAYQIPLKYFIFSAVPGAIRFVGVWWAGSATVMLLIGLLVGLILYLLTRATKVRTCETYIGGEILDPKGDLEVTGVDFYRSVQDMPPFSRMYQLAQKKLFDLYDLGTKVIFYFVEILRAAHTGRLPTYLTWVVLGLLGVMYMLIYQRS